MNTTIGYHTRLYGENSKKIVGGSFGGSFDSETVERLVSAHFDVIVKPSGVPVFVDKSGREVTLYVKVDASSTTKGRAALESFVIERQMRAVKIEEQDRAIEKLLDTMSNEEILARLQG